MKYGVKQIVDETLSKYGLNIQSSEIDLLLLIAMLFLSSFPIQKK